MKNYGKEFKSYLNDLAKKTPSPGGGSALCLALCLGISLLQKAMSYSLAKRKRLKDIHQHLEMIKRRIYPYIDQDSYLFNQLLRAKGKRKDMLFKKSEMIIIDTAKSCLKVFSLARRAKPAIKESIKSDFYIGIELAKVSFKGCIYNLEANKKIFGRPSKYIVIFRRRLPLR